MNKIQKQAKLLYKKLKGKFEVLSVVEFLGTLGYSVIFFGDNERDELMDQYGVELTNENAVTIFGGAKIVFINDEISKGDKLHYMLHECGHILLGHIAENQVHSIDGVICENEAEVFVYEVMHLSEHRRLKPALITVIIIIAFLCAGLFFNSPSTQTTSITAEPRAVAYDEVVYVTRTGECYHRASCRYATDYESSQMLKTEAIKTHKACSICKP